jgi:hypothetical protein
MYAISDDLLKRFIWHELRIEKFKCRLRAVLILTDEQVQELDRTIFLIALQSVQDNYSVMEDFWQEIIQMAVHGNTYEQILEYVSYESN